MAWQQAAVAAGLVTLAVLLVRGRQAPAAVFAGVAFAFILRDLISLGDALRQVTNTGLVTVVVVVLLLLLSVVLDKSRLREALADSLVPGTGTTRVSRDGGLRMDFRVKRLAELSSAARWPASRRWQPLRG